MEHQKLSLDQLTEYYKRLTFLKSIYTTLETEYRILHAQNRTPAEIVRLAQLQAAVEHIGYLQARVDSMDHYKDTALKASLFERIIRQRCASEALGGTCDTLLVVPCKDAGRHIHQTLFDTLRISDLESSPRMIFEKSQKMVEDFQLVFNPLPEPTPKVQGPVKARDELEEEHVFSLAKPKKPKTDIDKLKNQGLLALPRLWGLIAISRIGLA